MSGQLDYKFIVEFKEFEKIKGKIVRLFEIVFNRPFFHDFWHHFFRDSPCGPTSAVAIMDDKILAGFSILVHQEVMDPLSQKIIPYGLYMTAMIDPKYRTHVRIYVKMMDELKILAKERNFSFILSHPNQTALLPVTRLAGFQLLDQAQWVGGDLFKDPNYIKFIELENNKAFFSPRCLKWRLSRMKYDLTSGDAVIKTYKGQRQLIDWLNKPYASTTNLVFPLWKSFGANPFERINDHVFYVCAFSLVEDFDLRNLKKSLLFSDIF